MDFQKEHKFEHEEKNEDSTDVKTFSSVASFHLKLQHSSCITHLTILHTVHDIEIEIF